jgi:hypothetical protein
MERLAATRPAACPVPVAVNPGERLKGASGKTATAAWSLPNPPRWSAETAGREPETRLSRVRLVEAVLEPGADRTVPGDGLLERARLFFAFEPR